MTPEKDINQIARVELSLMELEQKGKLSIPLSGNCMWPVVRSGDMVTVEKKHYGGLKPGDVAVFQTTPQTFHANTQFRKLKEAERNSPPVNYVGQITRVKRDGKEISLAERSVLTRFFQLLACPSNPYLWNLPKTLRSKLRKRS